MWLGNVTQVSLVLFNSVHIYRLLQFVVVYIDAFTHMQNMCTLYMQPCQDCFSHLQVPYHLWVCSIVCVFRVGWGNQYFDCRNCKLPYHDFLLWNIVNGCIIKIKPLPTAIAICCVYKKKKTCSHSLYSQVYLLYSDLLSHTLLMINRSKGKITATVVFYEYISWNMSLL